MQNYRVKGKGGYVTNVMINGQFEHRCKRRELSVLVTGESEEDEPTNCQEFRCNSTHAENVTVVQSNFAQPEISLNSVMGITSPCTMKLMGCIEGQEVVVMVDPGATLNFISMEAVKKLGIAVSPSKEFGVSLGTGDSVIGEGICKSVVLELQGIIIVENFLPLALGNSDVIMGIQWLEKLGTTTTNWKTQTLRFQLGNEVVTLKGDPLLGRSGIFLKAMLRNLRKGEGFLIEFNFLQALQNETVGEQEGRRVP